MTPVRVQRKRAKGWRMPDNTVYVGRGSKWGNPYKVGEKYPRLELAVLKKDGAQLVLSDPRRINNRRDAVYEFSWLLNPVINRDELPAYPTVEEVRSELAGKNLACWCPLDKPCHADVLLEIANQKEKDNQ